MPVYALGDRVPDIHPEAFVHPDAVVIGDVRIGAQSSIWPGAVLRGDYGTVVVGERTSIQDGAVLHAVADHPTVIGDDCVVGHVAHLEGCRVHDRSLIGSGSVVLHEVVVESGATVAAGAVVRNRTHVPANALVVGVPGQVRLDASSEAPILANAAQYVANAQRYRDELRRL
ncbi:MAG: gamma carbonic anhydrase family protein [Acidobacteriota bacterium]|nr:gamma carbonic anhydrase family protein [Acidobacteriota bacterium]MDE3031231.1 gamma carbonic anhydrase family protein [Acidobacteriota bacterium]MDE3092228.1 gamma carbonic anhydrase family protein [Acidobacteriota bacterium]MDE3139848.1 gamma carbonic anhydrase family protein [Acidobacteriota bacterium]MDE3147500.1 gamma carbonic anhydrase family protein [Acidobacteriota bacterium]